MLGYLDSDNDIRIVLTPEEMDNLEKIILQGILISPNTEKHLLPLSLGIADQRRNIEALKYEEGAGLHFSISDNFYKFLKDEKNISVVVANILVYLREATDEELSYLRQVS